MIIPREGKYKFNGDFSFVRSHWFIDEGRWDELIEDTRHLLGLYHPFIAPFHPSFPPPC